MALVILTSTNGDFPLYFSSENYPPSLKSAFARIKEGNGDKLDNFVVEMVMKLLIGQPGQKDFRGELLFPGPVHFSDMHIVVADPWQKISGYSIGNVPLLSTAPIISDFSVKSGRVIVEFGLIHNGRVRILDRRSVCVFENLPASVQLFLNARNHSLKPALARQDQDEVLDWCFDELAKEPIPIKRDERFATLFCFEIHVADRMLNAKHKGFIANLLAGMYFS